MKKSELESMRAEYMRLSLVILELQKEIGDLDPTDKVAKDKRALLMVNQTALKMLEEDRKAVLGDSKLRLSLSTSSVNTSLPTPSRDNLGKLSDDLRARDILDVKVNGESWSESWKSSELRKLISETTYQTCAQVCALLDIKIDMFDRTSRSGPTQKMAAALQMLATDRETTIQANPTFIAGVYNTDTHLIDTHNKHSVPMAPNIDEDGSMKSTRNGMPDGVSASLLAFFEWKARNKAKGDGLLQGIKRIFAASDMNIMFKRYFVFVVDLDVGWIIYLKNDMRERLADGKLQQQQLHFIRVRVEDMASFWFAIHSTAESDSNYIYNEFTAELLDTLKALHIEWQFARIQLAGLSASKIFQITPGTDKEVKTDPKKQFAMKFNPSKERGDREAGTLRCVADVTAKAGQLHYACGCVHEGNVEFFQPVELHNGVEDTLQRMFLDAKEATPPKDAAPPVHYTSSARATHPPNRLIEEMNALNIAPKDEGWFNTGLLPIPPTRMAEAGDKHLIMYVGEALKNDISVADYQQLSHGLDLAREAGVMHCDLRRKQNVMRFRFGDAEPVCQLIDWDLSANNGEKVRLVRGSAQWAEAPACIKRQLKEADALKNGVKNAFVEVEWTYGADIAMLLEYMWHVAKGRTAERLNE